VPAYDHVCEDCGAQFEVRMSIAAYSEGAKPPCERCGSTRVARAFTAVNVLTSGRGGSSSGASCGGGGGFT
jgi:putative FmdB family regulatory protein